jgi:hypothetical protein
MSTLATKRAAGKQPVHTNGNTTVPRSPAPEPTRDWSKAVAHWRNVRDAKNEAVSDHSATLLTLNALKKDLVKGPGFPRKSDMISKLDDCRSVAIKHLTSAQEEHRQAARAVKAFKAHTISQKQLARQDISMRDAVLLLHTEDPNMTLGELREMMLNNAIPVVPGTPKVSGALQAPLPL